MYIKKLITDLALNAIASARPARKQSVVPTIMLGLAVAGGVAFIVGNLIQSREEEAEPLDRIDSSAPDQSTPRQKRYRKATNVGDEE